MIMPVWVFRPSHLTYCPVKSRMTENATRESTIGNICRMSKALNVPDLKMKRSRANAYAAVPESKMMPAEDRTEALIEFHNQSNGGVSALTVRVWPVAGLPTS